MANEKFVEGSKMVTEPISSRQIVGSFAAEKVDSFSSRSRLERQDDQIIELSWEDVKEGMTVGVGGFSRVSKVQVNRPRLENENLALKCLDRKKIDQDKFCIGAVDLALEGELLSRLRHENIIKLHGVTSGGPQKAYAESPRGYFLVLELLEDTLKHTLEKHRLKRGLRSLRSRGTSAAVLGRVEDIALGVAKGLDYLHQNNVVLRDLKPDNVGFDSQGTPKIFDLGFAREVHTIDAHEVAGSLRYMAPEVFLGHGTTLASDVYSYGVLLWEICTIEKPYKQLNSRDDFTESVIEGNYRPSCSSIQSAGLRRLIEACWDPNPENRPSMSQVVKVLRIEVSLDKRKTSSDPLLRGNTILSCCVDLSSGSSMQDISLDASFRGTRSTLSGSGSSKSSSGHQDTSPSNSTCDTRKLSTLSPGLFKALRRKRHKVYRGVSKETAAKAPSDPKLPDKRKSSSAPLLSRNSIVSCNGDGTQSRSVNYSLPGSSSRISGSDHHDTSPGERACSTRKLPAPSPGRFKALSRNSLKAYRRSLSTDTADTILTEKYILAGFEQLMI